MSPYEEHLRDSEVDTWQRAEAEQFLKDEAEATKAEYEELHKEWVEAGCPVLDPPEAEEDEDEFPF